jgi:hypothetical protein
VATEPTKPPPTFLERFDWSDVAFLAAGFCWGIPPTLLWCLWDQPQKWGIEILGAAVVVWIGFGYVCLRIALFIKDEETP